MGTTKQKDKHLESDRNPRDKYQLFAVTIQSLMTYSAETWTMSKLTEATFEGKYKISLRSAINTKRNEFVMNKRVFELAQCEKFSEKIERKRTRFAGHCFMRTKEETSRVLSLKLKHR